MTPGNSDTDDGHSARFVFDHESVVERTFTELPTDDLVSIGSVFDRCTFAGLKVSTPSLGEGRDQSVYRDCIFDRVRFWLLFGGNSRFERCSFRSVRISKWLCHDTELVDNTFTGRIAHALFYGTVEDQYQAKIGRVYNEFTGNDFSGAKLEGVEFRGGIDLSRQVLPAGPDYVHLVDTQLELRLARTRVEQWENSSERTDVLRILGILGVDKNNGQRAGFIRPKDFGPDKKKVDALTRALRPDPPQDDEDPSSAPDLGAGFH